MGTVLCKLIRYILCNIFVAYERDSKYCVSFRFVRGTRSSINTVNKSCESDFVSN